MYILQTASDSSILHFIIYLQLYYFHKIVTHFKKINLQMCLPKLLKIRIKMYSLKIQLTLM